MSSTTFHFDSGKYVIVREDKSKELSVARSGEVWYGELLGNNMIHILLDEIERLREYEYMYKELCDEHG